MTVAGDERLVEPAPLSTLIRHFPRRFGRSSESYASDVERELLEVRGISVVDVSLIAGTVHIVFDPSQISTAEIDRHLRASGLTLEDGPSNGPWLLIWLNRFSSMGIEGSFVVLTFIGMLSGLLLGWFDGPVRLQWIAYGIAYVFGSWYGLLASVESLRHRAVNIDLLMILAATGALLIGAPFEGAMLLFLFSLSNVLQAYAFGRSRRAISSLVELRPDTARVVENGLTKVLPIDDVKLGDHFVVRPGDRIPLDGVIEEGEASVDQSSVTGESVPVQKIPGDEVFSGTINENGNLHVRVTRLAHESTIARLIHMVEEAQSRKAPTQRLIDRIEQPYVLGVFAITILAIAIPSALGRDFDPTFYRAMTIMVAASPCAVIISTPAAILSSITAAARSGVLFKGGEYVESSASIRAVAFDKTGTLTQGDTQLTDIAVRSGISAGTPSISSDELLGLAAAVQQQSEHHLANATVKGAENRGISIPNSSSFQSVVGKGVQAVVDGRTIHIGNERYFDTLSQTVIGKEEGIEEIRKLQSVGKTSVLVGIETTGDIEIIGWLGFADAIRPGAAAMIDQLREMGIEHIVMLTGDTEVVAEQVGASVGVDEVQADLLPEEKVAAIRALEEEYGTVAMVGDGVNDAPALATASIGVAMGAAGTDVALETADIVLMADDLSKIPYAFELARSTRRTLIMNLVVAFGAIAIMLIAILTTGIPLPLAVIGHEGSTVLVSLNGLRLIGFKG